MSRENVEVIRRAGEAFGAGDLDRAFSEFFDPKVEWHTAAEDPDAGTHRGLDAFGRYLAHWNESFEGLTASLPSRLVGRPGQASLDRGTGASKASAT